MKKLLLSLLLIISFSVTAYCQEALIYSEVIKVDSISQAELYNRAKLWFSTAFVDSKSVIQLDDKEDGQIVAKAKMVYNPKVFTGSSQTEGYINYTIKVFVKYGRYKYEMSDFFHDPKGCEYGKYCVGKITTDKDCPNPKTLAKGWSNKVWNDIKNQIDVNTTSLLAGLRKNMDKQTESKKEDW